MPFKQFRENYYDGLNWPSVVKSVNAIYTSTTLATAWTPATGKKFRLLGYSLTCHVGVVLGAASVAGDYVFLCDNAVALPISVIGVSQIATAVAGSRLDTGAQAATALANATTSGATANQWAPLYVRIPGGYLSAVANNVLKVAVGVAGTGVARDVAAGKLHVTGTVWGHEE